MENATSKVNEEFKKKYITYDRRMESDVIKRFIGKRVELVDIYGTIYNGTLSKNKEYGLTEYVDILGNETGEGYTLLTRNIIDLEVIEKQENVPFEIPFAGFQCEPIDGIRLRNVSPSGFIFVIEDHRNTINQYIVTFDDLWDYVDGGTTLGELKSDAATIKLLRNIMIEEIKRVWPLEKTGKFRVR
jgi:hypothetical protein